MSTTPDGPQDTTPEAPRTDAVPDPTEGTEAPGTGTPAAPPAGPGRDATTEAIATDAAADRADDAQTQRIAPAPTQQFPQHSAPAPTPQYPQATGQGAAPAAPAPGPAHPAPYQQTPGAAAAPRPPYGHPASMPNGGQPQQPYPGQAQQHAGHPGQPQAGHPQAQAGYPQQQAGHPQPYPGQPGQPQPHPAAQQQATHAAAQQHAPQPVAPAHPDPRSADPLAAFRTAPGPDGSGPSGPEHHAAFGAPGDPAATRTRPRSERGRLWLPVAGVGVTAALLASLGTAAFTGAFDDDRGSTRTADASSIGRNTDTAPVSDSTAENPDWQAVASAVQESVVAIQVTTNAGGAEGSGVIVDAEGHIVTNNHVVSGAQDGKVQVTLTDGRIFTADVVGTDPTTDLAVLKLEDAPDDLTPAALGDSGQVKVGDPVMAVGNPLGLANTVTTGIVSALDRPVSTTEDGASESVVTNAIQIDAAINPGNSGGPLFDVQGRVIGITSSIATTSSQSGSIGLGFAIPVNLADMIAGQLISDGTAEHAILGVVLSNDTATADGVTRAGAKVESVSSDSPAAKAGIKEGDVIVAIDDKAVGGAESLTGYVRTHKSGDKVTLTVIRDGKALEVDVTLAVREETGAQSPSDQGNSGQAPSNPEEMTPQQLWEWFQRQQGQG